MSPDTLTTLVHMVLVGLQASWLSLGAHDNWRYPAVNGDDVKRVLRLEALEDYPEVQRRVAHRKWDDSRSSDWLFRLLVIVETLVAAMLWISVCLLGASLISDFDPSRANMFAIISVLGFTSIWGTMLVGGQWFYIWYGEFGQSTHFKLLLWGICTLVVLLP